MKLGRAKLRALVLGAFFLSGAAALAYEVVWTRALSVILGSTTYALSTMLATFMLGLAIGGSLGGRLADRAPRHLLYLGVCELGIGIGGLVSVPIIQRLPATYLWLYRTFHLHPFAFFSLQVVLCAVVMLGPTLLMGMTFPLAARAVTERLDEVGRSVGNAYTFNTLGAVLGSMLTGFLLVPWLGLRGSTAVAGAVNLTAGASLILFSGDRGARRALLLALLYPPAASALLADPGWTLVNFYHAHRHLDGLPYEEIIARDHAGLEKLFEGEFAEGSLRAFRSPGGFLMLQVGGKIEGTTAADLWNTQLLAYLPIAAHARPERMLVVGLGAGVTLGTAKPLVPRVDVVEIHSGVVDVVRRFGPRGVLDGVEVIHDDARNFLLKAEDRVYDVISSEPSYPTDLGISNLFTQEYYALAATRLAPDGIYCQWLPYYLLRNRDVTTMIKTFASVFPYASLWKVPDSMDLVMIGSRAPFARGTDGIRQRVSELAGGSPPMYVLSRSPEAIRDIARRADVEVNTDDRPIIEFSVARNLLVGELALDTPEPN